MSKMGEMLHLLTYMGITLIVTFTAISLSCLLYYVFHTYIIH